MALTQEEAEMLYRHQADKKDDNSEFMMDVENDGEDAEGNKRAKKRTRIDDVSKTSLKQYMDFFESNFLSGLYKEIKSKFRDEVEQRAAQAGNW